MYSLAHFTEKDIDRVIAFMHEHPFVTLCGASKDGTPVATQVPVLISMKDQRITLRGHFMKKTDHHLAFTENASALVLFTGAHEYVSASWYSDPVQASTWNYMSVHARGKLEFTSEEELRDILRDTTALFEKNSATPSLFENLSSEYVGRLIKAIIGFTIEIEEIGNVFKLSQNRDKSSFENIIAQLRERGADARVIAAEMEKRAHELYGKTSR